MNAHTTDDKMKMSDYLHRDPLDRLGARNVIKKDSQSTKPNLQVGFKNSDFKTQSRIEIPKLSSFDKSHFDHTQSFQTSQMDPKITDRSNERTHLLANNGQSSALFTTFREN